MKYFVLILSVVILVSCSRSPKFQSLSSGQTGVDFKNTVPESDSFNVMTFEHMYNGAGVGIADLNNDGLPDLIFAGNMVSPRIYLNLGNFKFRDITSNFEGLTNDEWYSGVAVVDINSDGWPDIYFTATANDDPEKCKNRLWVNQGIKDGRGPMFKEMAKQYGIENKKKAVTASFFDYDRDGFLDLYVLNNTINKRMDTHYRDKITDGSAANNDRLYHNNGDGTFTDVTIKAGIVFEGFGLGLAIGDVNKDGYPDIYVSNDYTSNDLLYINNGDGTFSNKIKKYLSYQSRSSMGDDMADVNNDGYPDIFTLDMFPEMYSKKKQTINGFSYPFYYGSDERYGYEHQYVRNMLHLNNGLLNGELLPFSEVGQMEGIYQTDWSWSPLFADFNNDGKKDLLITCGYPVDMTDKDWTKYEITVFPSLASQEEVIRKAPAIKLPIKAFQNMGDFHFKRMTDWLPDIASYSYGAAFVDLDNDGDLDYVVNNLNGEAFIFRNNTVENSHKNANYLKINLKGKFGNTMAIGAKVELWSKLGYQYEEHFLGRGYASSVDPVMHFGLGDNTVVDSIRITWPASGYITVLKKVAVNQKIEVDEKTSVPHTVNYSQVNKNLLFTERDSLLRYTHVQDDFIDFLLPQKIIPHKFSQIGPVIAKGDLNKDGREDLIIGSTDKSPTSVWLRSGAGFKEVKIDSLTYFKGLTESDIVITDINSDGYNDVVAVAGGYENREENEYQGYVYENHNGSFHRKNLPIPPFPASVVRACDFNHDGYPELFVGSRVKKGMYPYANHSWLIYNDKGNLYTKNDSKMDLGMVTDAIWTDYDNDGWEDLLVVRDWNSIVLFKNMNGKELVAQNIPELEKMHGIWYSIAAGDFNKDGYTDYIVGNLGENTRFTVSDKYPMSLYAIDLDNDGTIDPVSTAYWKDNQGNMTEYPINYFDELGSQTNYFLKRFRDYTSFSLASFDQMLTPDMMKRLQFKLTVNTLSSYILWNEKGKFRWEKLPEELQVSPITKMIVRDLNGDGYPDVIVAGNDYTYDVATGFYDANKGIVMLSKGKGNGFDILTPAQSGLILQGMVGSLLYIDGDTSLVVAGINRAKANVFEHTGVKK
jgi:enediyne biosynthesis protein E4